MVGLGEFISKKIYVKLKKNSDLSYFENGLFDYRVGCALCEIIPNVCSLKTNFLEIVNENDYFLINDLKVVDNNDTFSVFYETTNKVIISKLSNIYKKFHNLNVYYNISDSFKLDSKEYYNSKNSYFESKYYENIKKLYLNHDNESLRLIENYWNNKIDSFNKDQLNHIDKLNHIIICPNCYKLLLVMDNIEESDFTLFNPLITFYCYFIFSNFDILDFKNQNDKKLIEKYLFY